MPTAIHRKLVRAEAGDLPSAILKLSSGWLVAGDVQPLKGYVVLLAAPVVTDFNHLSEEARARYGIDMGRIGDALIEVVGAYRINYETWGNLDPALHTHIVPRFPHEPDDLRVKPPRHAYGWDRATPFDPARDRAWMDGVREVFRRRGWA